jgi:ankyrin repeat protein
LRHDIVRHILEKGADPNQPNYDGLAPLDLAKKLRKQELVDTLLEFGADPDIKSSLVTAWLKNQFDLDPKLCQKFLKGDKTVIFAASNFKEATKENKTLILDSVEIEEETKEKLMNGEIDFNVYKGDKCVLVFLTPYKYETLY